MVYTINLIKENSTLFIMDALSDPLKVNKNKKVSWHARVLIATTKFGEGLNLIYMDRLFSYLKLVTFRSQSTLLLCQDSPSP